MKTLFVTLLMLFANSIFASENQFPLKRNWLLIGGEGGFLTKNSVTAPEINNSGFELGVKGVYSRYFDSWVMDAGLGWRFDRMKKDGVEVETKAFFLDPSVRYRLNNKWSLGLSIPMLFGEDVSFSDVATNSDDKSFSAFAGIRAMYDVFKDDQTSVWRFGGQIATDLNISDRQVTQIQFIVEYGWPFGGESKAEPEPTPMPKPVAKLAPIELNLMDAGVRFASNSAKLVGKSETIIKKLATVLSLHEKNWQRVNISGHTDITGKYQYNVNLSLDRAKTVLDTMVKYGVPANKLRSAGYGPDRPIDPRDTKEAYAKNRRVEVQIESSNPTPEFADALKKVITGK